MYGLYWIFHRKRVIGGLILFMMGVPRASNLGQSLLTKGYSQSELGLVHEWAPLLEISLLHGGGFCLPALDLHVQN